jgi:large subunit ribosomal protein L32e
MTTETKRLIRVRTEKSADFKRDGFGKKPQLSNSWRKPRGLHNKQREQRKAKGALPKPGYGSPIAVRGMHPSGFFEVLVFTEKDLENLDSKTQAIRISAGVGARKRKLLQEKAKEAGFKILNTRVIKASVTEEKSSEKTTDASKDKKEKGAKEDKKTSASAKKSPAKALDAKKDAETKKSAKPVAAKAIPESKESKSAKSPTKKPAAGKAKAEPAKSTKKSSTGVKKND